MSVKYKWATLGCGVIGHQLAAAMGELGGSLYAVGNRTYEKGAAFAEKYGIGKVYQSPEEIFSDPGVDIVYISTPHNTHIKYLRQALAAGKHVLCEKSITLNSAELDEAIALAKGNGVVLAEAMTIFHMPIYEAIAARMRAGDFGPLKLITMNFGSYKPYDMKNRFFNMNLAGGAMLDIGVYALSCCRTFMSGELSLVASDMALAPTGVDEQDSLLIRSSAGEMATVMLSLHAKQPKRATLSFDRAYVEIFEYPRADRAVVTWTETGKTETIEAGNTAQALAYEVADMERAVAGEKDIHLDWTRDVMQLMTEARYAHGMRYPEEK